MGVSRGKSGRVAARLQAKRRGCDKKCRTCDRWYKHEANYRKHVEKCQKSRVLHKCHFCPRKFRTGYHLGRHVLAVHPGNATDRVYPCSICDEVFRTREALNDHRRKSHHGNHQFHLVESCHGRRVVDHYRIFIPEKKSRDIHSCLQFVLLQMVGLAEELASCVPLFTLRPIMALRLQQVNPTSGQTLRFADQHMSATTFTVSRMAMETARERILRSCMQLDRTLDQHTENGSGWSLVEVYYVDVHYNLIAGMSGSAKAADHVVRDLTHLAQYKREFGGIVSHPVLDRKKEEEGECFYWAVATGLAKKNPKWGRSAEQVFSGLVRVSDKSRPVHVNELDKFEKLNSQLDVAVQVVYVDEENDVLPVVASKRKKARNEIVLVLFHTPLPSGEDGRVRVMAHYALVEDPQRLFAKRFRASKGDGYDRTVKAYICWNCHKKMDRLSSYNEHVKFCHEIDHQQVTMPMPGEIKSFLNSEKSNSKVFRSGYMMFWDFEALQVEPESACSCSKETLENTAAVDYAKRRRMDMGSEDAALDEIQEEMWRQHQLEEEKRVEETLVRLGKRSRKRRSTGLPSHPSSRRRVCTHRGQVMKVQPPFAYYYIVVNREGEVVDRGGDVAPADSSSSSDDPDWLTKRFVKDVLDMADKWLPSLSPGKPMVKLTDRQRREADRAVNCYLCEAPLGGSRVMDHDHLTGEFLGVAHSKCNLKRRETTQLTCFAHNFTGYDSHFLVNAVAEEIGKRLDKDPSTIPINGQKFKAITLNERIKFVDSLAFLSDSLANLVEMLKRDGSAFPILRQMPGMTDSRVDMMTKKGVYPYSFATSVARLAAAKELPPRSAFFNDIGREECSPEDYERAGEVWDEWECDDMLDYTSVYVASDVYLLADVMVNFRNKMWENFGLDLCQYLSLPHMGIDVMLKETGAKIELIHDKEMYKLLRSNIRGGLSYANLRHAGCYEPGPTQRAEQHLHRRLQQTEVASDSSFLDWLNRKHAEGDLLVQHEYDPGSPYDRYVSDPGNVFYDEQTLLYLDANNLYGHAMSRPLPLRDFRWMTRKELDRIDVLRDVTDQNGPGYIFEVDLEYPPHLHDKHCSLPLAPHEVNIDYEMLSPYSRRCLELLRGEKYAKRYSSKKLTSTFLPRTKYLVHGLNLKFYLEQGLVLKKMHRGIRFYQEDFIRPFIEKCTRMRAAAATETEKNMWKLLCNSVYGKLIESANKRMTAFFDTTAEKAVMHASHPLFRGATICNERLSISFQGKKRVKVDQCHAAGFTILELSKLHMQKLWYEEIQAKLNPRGLLERMPSIVMTDTDSFLFRVCGGGNETDVLKKLAGVMDFSNYPKNHHLYDDTRKKIPGFLKNEVPAGIIQEAVALRAKAYAIRIRPLKTDDNGLDIVNHVQPDKEFKRMLETFEDGEADADYTNCDDEDEVTEILKCKGVSRAAQNQLSIDTYRQMIDSIDAQDVVQYQIQSRNHVNRLVRMVREAVSSFDDKRYLACPIHSVPYGSFRTAQLAENNFCYYCSEASSNT